jgi:hypothetical protein
LQLGELEPPPAAGVDLSRPNVARVYDYLLGGHANWAIDREFAKKVMSAFPLAPMIAKANRLFLHRVVRHLVGIGVRQFIDVGSGVPTMGATHEIAEETGQPCRVVYVDNEPVAVAHSQVLLDEFGDPLRHASINADLRAPDELWQRALACDVLDPTKPVALLMLAVLHFRQPGWDGVDIGTASMARLRELLSAGSYLAISHATVDDVPATIAAQCAQAKDMFDHRSSPMVFRSAGEILGLFGDFDIVDPGVAWTAMWHPEHARPSEPLIRFTKPNESAVLAGLARKR